MAAAAKPFKENPFYASDLEKGAKEGAVYQADEHVIPVRSWARGSPFARGGSKVTSSVGERSASTPGGDGEYGDLEKYWPGEDIPPREDDGDDDEADDEEVQEEDYLDDSGRPELASLADNPNNSFVEAFNQVYAQYKQDAAAAAASASGSNTPRQEGGGGGEDGAPSYEESQRAYAKLSKRLSEPSLKGAAAKQQKQQQDEDEDEGGGEDIGDLAAYLGLTDTQGENVFFNNQPGFRADGDGEDEDEEAEEEEDDEDEDYLNDARFEEEEEEEEAFQPLKRRGENNNSSSSGGGSNSPRKAQLKTLTKEEVREIQSEYQNLYAALQSPRAAPAPGQGQGQGAAGKSRGLSKSQKAATAGRELQLQLLKAKSRAGVEIKESVLAPRKEKEREREREKRAPRHLAGSDSDDDDQQQQLGQQQGQERTDAEHKHRQYLQSVAAKRKQEDELLLRLALKVTNCLLLPVLSFFSLHLPC